MDERPRYPLRTYDRTLIEIGRVVLIFNEMESTLRHVLWLATTRDEVHQALTIHMSNVTLTDAIRTIANEFLQPDEGSHLKHCADLFDRAREYRNFYVHGFRYIDMAALGNFISHTAKGRLSTTHMKISWLELEAFADWEYGAVSYMRQFAQALDYNRRAIDPEDNTANLPLCTFPEKFPLRDKLQKLRQDRQRA